MTQDISKALEAVKGGTSPTVASMIHGVSVEEIEAARDAQPTAIAPGYSDPQLLGTMPALERERSPAKVRRKRKRKARPPLPDPLDDEATSRETAVFAPTMQAKHGISQNTLFMRCRSMSPWRKEPATDADHERLSNKDRRLRYVYWVAEVARVPTTPEMGMSSAHACGAARLGEIMNRDARTVANWARRGQRGCRRRAATAADLERLGKRDGRQRWLFWIEEVKG